MLMNNINPDGTRWSPATAIIQKMLEGLPKDKPLKPKKKKNLKRKR
jgi:hypothetical protein